MSEWPGRGKAPWVLCHVCLSGVSARLCRFSGRDVVCDRCLELRANCAMTTTRRALQIDPRLQELLELAAAHLPDRCRCLIRSGHERVECGEHRMGRLAREILREQKATRV